MNKYIAAAAVALTGVTAAFAQIVDDPGTLATDAETLFGVVSGITMSVVGFYILVKIVKKVTKS